MLWILGHQFQRHQLWLCGKQLGVAEDAEVEGDVRG